MRSGKQHRAPRSDAPSPQTLHIDTATLKRKPCNGPQAAAFGGRINAEIGDSLGLRTDGAAHQSNSRPRFDGEHHHTAKSAAAAPCATDAVRRQHHRHEERHEVRTPTHAIGAVDGGPQALDRRAQGLALALEVVGNAPPSTVEILFDGR